MGGTFYHLVGRLDRIGSDSTRPGRMCDYVCACEWGGKRKEERREGGLRSRINTLYSAKGGKKINKYCIPLIHYWLSAGPARNPVEKLGD